MPREFEPDVERIQQQMQRLGERLSELSGGIYKTALPKPVAKLSTAIRGDYSLRRASTGSKEMARRAGLETP